MEIHRAIATIAFYGSICLFVSGFQHWSLVFCSIPPQTSVSRCRLHSFCRWATRPACVGLVTSNIDAKSAGQASKFSLALFIISSKLWAVLGEKLYPIKSFLQLNSSTVKGIAARGRNAKSNQVQDHKLGGSLLFC